MKKTNVFFMKLLIGIVLLGFSGTSSAYDLSKWTSKSVEWAKHVAQWFGYGDKDEKRPVTDSSETNAKATETRINKEDISITLNTRNRSDQVDSALYNFQDTFSFSHEIPDYSIKITGPLKNTSIDFYRWYGDSINPLSITDKNFDPQTVSAFEQKMNGESINNGTMAARFSYNLPFLSILHQGIAPAVSLESSYRFDRPSYTTTGLQEADYRWKTGISYKGNNLINLPVSSVGINWGVGYDYNAAPDNFNSFENSHGTNGYHSGNIFAGSYWYNLKLYTMFMYLYDSESRGGMTILNATYSPSLRWTYGIRANFYNGKKEVNGKGLSNNPELVSFTATYRWD
jgi:hypothetical protein